MKNDVRNSSDKERRIKKKNAGSGKQPAFKLITE
jgi:hypothetical protein